MLSQGRMLMRKVPWLRKVYHRNVCSMLAALDYGTKDASLCRMLLEDFDHGCAARGLSSADRSAS